MRWDPPQLILLGPPASGKGTQGRRLAEELGLAYLSTGALLRRAVADDTPAGREAKPILARGGYVPDELMFRLIGPWLEEHREGWVLDGFPRTLAQDEFLREWLTAHGERIDAAIALEVPKVELVRRIENRVECPSCRWSGQRQDLGPGDACPKCGGPAAARSDDSLENFLSRFREFAEHTLPVIERYAAEGRLGEVDATAPVAEVAARVRRSVETLSHGQTQENQDQGTA